MQESCSEDRNALQIHGISDSTNHDWHSAINTNLFSSRSVLNFVSCIKLKWAGDNGDALNIQQHCASIISGERFKFGTSTRRIILFRRLLSVYIPIEIK